MQPGTPEQNEPALVTALITPLLRLRAALGSGVRPTAEMLAALAAVPGSVRASGDVHRAGVSQLAATDTAAAALSIMNVTAGRIGDLATVAETLAPLLFAAYDTRDRAAAELDMLISGFRAQATPLVNAARSQADLDAVVSMAADYVRDGVRVIATADVGMDALTAKVNEIDQPGITAPGGQADTGS
ncbi:hypothetical protein D7D52_34210 [Nocardia yunnanensis]|uniref:Uncharacterized protein n=1 Tax=Nocardia yunnanensis TaxID=2382165 RepID=A0A386ZKD4_9NOCA|nr:hypothetical protein [Nocardia yunnanensis]AYF78041.1 hypothetical protein D7D52_34210 [Nocardia yunnanensis]